MERQAKEMTKRIPNKKDLKTGGQEKGKCQNARGDVIANKTWKEEEERQIEKGGDERRKE